jgi:hypothetical protein
LPGVPWRFDIVSVYYQNPTGSGCIELFKNAFVIS